MDCKVPVMFTYLGIIIIFSTFGHAYAGQSTTILNIKKDGDEASGFTNGQKLCFSCYDTKIDAEKCIIKLITAGQEVEVPVVKENEKINNRNSYSGCLEMNFTSTDVEVKCLLFGKANDKIPSTINILRLTRKNPVNAAEATTARFGQTPKETSKSSNSSPTKSPDVVTPPRSASSATSSKGTNTIQLDTSHEPCSVAASKERTISNNTVVFYLGDDIRLKFISQDYINRIICNVSHPSNIFNFTVIEIDPKLNLDDHEKIHKQNLFKYIKNVTKTYDGNWSCKILTLKDILHVSNMVIVDNSTYRQTFCRARVHIQTPPPEPVTPNTKEDEKEEKFPDMYIYIIVGVVVALIIITQRAVVLYLKCKAKRTARLESLSLRAQDQDDSSKRYSSSPAVKISAFSRIMNRTSNRDDNNIYETVDEVRNAERETSPEPNISKRLPLPLPIHSHEADPSAHHQDRTSSYDDSGSLVGSLKRFRGERGASPAHLSKTPLQPIEEASQFKNSTLTRPRAGIGQASVTSELNNILKMRKASVGVPKNYNPPPPPKKHSIPSRIRKQYFGAADNSHQPEQKPFVAEAPNPLPTGKSAILLGLAPGPAPRQRLKPAPLNPPKTPNPVKPATKIPNPPSKPVASGYKPPNPPLKPLSESATSPKPATAQKRLTNAPVKSFAPGKPIPVLPKTTPTTIGAPGTLKPVAHVPPVKPLKAPNPQPPKFENPGFSQIHPHEMSKPLPPLPREVIEEPVYEEYDEEPYYNEEWTPPDPEPARFERPAPPNPEPPRFERPTTHFAPPVTSRPKPPPHRPPVQEEIYEEYPEEPVYNSDEEWTYEPLEKYNIYSS